MTARAAKPFSGPVNDFDAVVFRKLVVRRWKRNNVAQARFRARKRLCKKSRSAKRAIRRYSPLLWPVD